MPYSVDGMNAVLDAYLDDVATFEVGLFEGDPLTDGIEVTGGGYARASIDAADWAAAAAGARANDAAVSFPSASGAWDRSATHFGLFVSGDPDPWPGSGELTDELMVTSAGAGPVFPIGELVVFYEDSVDEGA